MKRSTKALLLTALIVFCVGVLLATISFVIALSQNVDIYSDEGREYNISSTRYSLSDLRALSGMSDSQTISELTLDLQFYNIIVRRTDGETQIELHNADQNNLDFTYRSGALSIYEKKPVNRFGFQIDGSEISFGGLRHLFHSVSNRPAAQIVLLWNPVDEISSFKLNLTCGNIRVDALPETAGLHLNLVVGSVDVQNCDSPDKLLNARVTVGSIRSEGNRFDSASYHCTCGNMKISSSDNQTSVNTVVGNVELTPAKPEGEYLLRANTTFGAVYLFDGTNIGPQHNTPAGENQSLIQVNATVGNIHLKNSSTAA